MRARGPRTKQGRRCAATLARRNTRKRAAAERWRANLLRLMEEQGMDAAQLAERSGLPLRQIERYVRDCIPVAGRWRFCLNSALVICDALGCDLDAFRV